jgi:hypothetical protein
MLKSKSAKKQIPLISCELCDMHFQSATTFHQHSISSKHCNKLTLLLSQGHSIVLALKSGLQEDDPSGLINGATSQKTNETEEQRDKSGLKDEMMNQKRTGEKENRKKLQLGLMIQEAYMKSANGKEDSKVPVSKKTTKEKEERKKDNLGLRYDVRIQKNPKENEDFQVPKSKKIHSCKLCDIIGTSEKSLQDHQKGSCHQI